MFLFGDAHEEHYRESERSVVAIFNAKAEVHSKGELTLKVSELGSILKLGTAADFAFCGSRKKVGLQMCNNPCKSTSRPVVTIIPTQLVRVTH
jgi:hypothetical protein